ncbi:unnamed protein product [Thelazia callipaeda]|uniref:RING-type domain-containing protein n=1 Tax=Thelazia callipaeda TaxID=103827 RepID=A0A0N5CJK0_THECL|nr:unnamed protein product [Thelazia callipaeda]
MQIPDIVFGSSLVSEMERSKKCPTCRAKTIPKNIVKRLYFSNFGNESSDSVESSTLVAAQNVNTLVSSMPGIGEMMGSNGSIDNTDTSFVDEDYDDIRNDEDDENELMDTSDTNADSWDDSDESIDTDDSDGSISEEDDHFGDDSDQSMVTEDDQFLEDSDRSVIEENDHPLEDVVSAELYQNVSSGSSNYVDKESQTDLQSQILAFYGELASGSETSFSDASPFTSTTFSDSSYDSDGVRMRGLSFDESDRAGFRKLIHEGVYDPFLFKDD